METFRSFFYTNFYYLDFIVFPEVLLHYVCNLHVLLSHIEKYSLWNELYTGNTISLGKNFLSIPS